MECTHHGVGPVSLCLGREVLDHQPDEKAAERRREWHEPQAVWPDMLHWQATFRGQSGRLVASQRVKEDEVRAA